MRVRIGSTLALVVFFWAGCAAEPGARSNGALGAGAGQSGAGSAASAPPGTGTAGTSAVSGGGGSSAASAGSAGASATSGGTAGTVVAGAGTTGGGAGSGGSGGRSGGSSGSSAAGGGGTGTGGAGSGAAGTGSGAAGDGGANPYPPIQNGCSGYATRYWDCCKPHCGWSANVPGGVAPLATCSQSDGSMGDVNARNSCEGGPAFMCHSMAPWAASNRLAYGFAAIAARGDICGRCYQLQFTGSSHNGGADPGSAAIAGKTMIVQTTNVGGDVGSGQFDILTPGGGVGAYNACSTQWGVSASELGAQYGGLLSRCKQEVNASDHQALKSCVMQRCTSVFESRGLSELAAGCKWFVDWFEVADNPSLVYKEIACPAELQNRGMRRSANLGTCG